MAPADFDTPVPVVVRSVLEEITERLAALTDQDIGSMPSNVARDCSDDGRFEPMGLASDHMRRIVILSHKVQEEMRRTYASCWALQDEFARAERVPSHIADLINLRDAARKKERLKRLESTLTFETGLHQHLISLLSLEAQRAFPDVEDGRTLVLGNDWIVYSTDKRMWIRELAEKAAREFFSHVSGGRTSVVFRGLGAFDEIFGFGHGDDDVGFGYGHHGDGDVFHGYTRRRDPVDGH